MLQFDKYHKFTYTQCENSVVYVAETSQSAKRLSIMPLRVVCTTDCLNSFEHFDRGDCLPFSLDYVMALFQNYVPNILHSRVKALMEAGQDIEDRTLT